MVSELFKKGAAFVLSIVLILLGLTTSEQPSYAAAGTFFNPIVSSGADPWMIQYNGVYYLTRTTGNNVTIWKSDSISGVESGPKVTVWSNANTAFKDVWAPELHYYDGYWYIYFSADENGVGATHRMYVLKSATSDPFSNYTFIGQLTDPSDQWAIDGTVLTYNDRLYFIWSGWNSETDRVQRLFIAPMDSPTHISGNRVLISSPTYSWETSARAINEGPEVLQHGGKTFIVYSANSSASNAYCLGMLTLEGADPLDPAAWVKTETPVFKSAGIVYGPGHNSFTQSVDGTEDWIIYHAAKYSGAGWKRTVRAQKFSWNGDGTPNFGTPVSTDLPMALPSGETLQRTTYEAEQAAATNTLVVNEANASGGKVVGHIDYADSSVQFNVQVPVSGNYTMYVRYDNGTAGNSTHNVSVNNGTAQTITYPKTGGWGHQNIATLSVALKAGSNTIQFTKGTSFAELDCIQIPIITPITSAALSPEVPNGKNGWYTQQVTVSLSATDQLTSVAESVYSLDGGTTWQTYTAPITFSQDGTYTVTYRSSDIAGNEEIAKAVSFKLDTKAPKIEVAIPGDGSIYEDSGDLTPLVTTIDTASGVDNSKTTVTLDTYSYTIGTTVPLLSLPLGSHSLVVSSADLAGNSGSKTVVFHTVSSINSLKALVTRFAKSKEIDNAGIANSLQVKLENGDLRSFVNEVQAQDGKHISNDVANYLLRGARFLLSQQ
jgi:GH43 family beta-xylosidase